MTTSLEIALLGPFGLWRDGRPIELPSRPAQLLLAYLLLNPGPQPREALATVLWPESTADNARANLRHALWQLRLALEPETDPPFLLVDAHSIAFNPETCRLDVATLESGPPGEAVSAYRGELLPGFYESWVELERERLAAVFDRRMAAWLNELSLVGRWEEVSVEAERWIGFGGAPEAAYRALMRAHAALGDAGRVMAAYHRCREALRAELGVEPSTETRMLAEALARGGAGSFAAPGAAITPLPDGEAARSPALVAALSEAALARRQADLYRRAARRSNRLALAALLGMAVLVGGGLARRWRV